MAAWLNHISLWKTRRGSNLAQPARVRARVHSRPGSRDPARPPLRGGPRKLFEEKTSGARKKRPQLERLLTELRADDVVVVTRLDRLARSTSELLRIAETTEEKNAELQSIAEPWADTTTPAGCMVLTVFAGIAEFERSLIATRTEEGRRAAQARGVPFGRPPKLRPDQRTLARHLIEEGKSVSAVARTFHVHVATIYRCLHDKAAL